MLEKLLLNKEMSAHITLKPGLTDVCTGVGPRGSWVPATPWPPPKDPPASSSSLRTVELNFKIMCLYGSDFLLKHLFYFWSHGGRLHLYVPTQVIFRPKYSPAHLPTFTPRSTFPGFRPQSPGTGSVRDERWLSLATTCQTLVCEMRGEGGPKM